MSETQITDDLISAVEDELGMGNRAWDMVCPKEIAAAVLKCAGKNGPNVIVGDSKTNKQVGHLYVSKVPGNEKLRPFIFSDGGLSPKFIDGFEYLDYGIPVFPEQPTKPEIGIEPTADGGYQMTPAPEVYGRKKT